MTTRMLLISSILALLPAIAVAQGRAQTRDGFWFNRGLGFGSAGCDGCNGRDGALTVALAVGGTLSRKVSR